MCNQSLETYTAFCDNMHSLFLLSRAGETVERAIMLDVPRHPRVCGLYSRSSTTTLGSSGKNLAYGSLVVGLFTTYILVVRASAVTPLRPP
eukprot:278463-Pyramimonas_sp.AAC.1